MQSFSKIYENIVLQRRLSFLTKGNILVPNQYGFWQGRSAYIMCMAITELLDKISGAIDSGVYRIGIVIDLSKAFDTINHSILLDKLEYYGIRDLPLNGVIATCILKNSMFIWMERLLLCVILIVESIRVLS